MPCLLLKNARLVKTIQFKDPHYVGDPVNAIKIYNEKEVDELILLDISATSENRRPPFDKIAEVTNECFMPLTYGGGIRTLEDIKRLLDLGVEKFAINSYAVENSAFIREAAQFVGSQAIIVSIDAKRTSPDTYEVYSHGGKNPTGLDPAEFAKKMEDMGAGEILLTSIDQEGTMNGYDTELIRRVSSAVNVPVIACGGAGRPEHFADAVNAGASACASGSMVVYQGKNRAVLINFPTQKELAKVLGEKR